jgi:hypothetical protein
MIFDIVTEENFLPPLAKKLFVALHRQNFQAVHAYNAKETLYKKHSA